jgi:hypothetical protein
MTATAAPDDLTQLRHLASAVESLRGQVAEQYLTAQLQHAAKDLPFHFMRRFARAYRLFRLREELLQMLLALIFDFCRALFHYRHRELLLGSVRLVFSQSLS